MSPDINGKFVVRAVIGIVTIKHQSLTAIRVNTFSERELSAPIISKQLIPSSYRLIQVYCRLIKGSHRTLASYSQLHGILLLYLYYKKSISKYIICESNNQSNRDLSTRDGSGILRCERVMSKEEFASSKARRRRIEYFSLIHIFSPFIVSMYERGVRIFTISKIHAGVLAYFKIISSVRI